MKIISHLDQPSKKYAGFLISHVQVLSALLVILSVGESCRWSPLAPSPICPSRNCRQSRLLQKYSGTKYFFPEGTHLAFDFELTMNRWSSLRTGCVLQHLANDCLTHSYTLQLQWYKTSLCLLSSFRICIHKKKKKKYFFNSVSGVLALIRWTLWKVIGYMLLSLHYRQELSLDLTAQDMCLQGEQPEAALQSLEGEESLQYGLGQLEHVGLHGCVYTVEETRARVWIPGSADCPSCLILVPQPGAVPCCQDPVCYPHTPTVS